MRILALSQLPNDWGGAVAAWRQTNEGFHRNGAPSPGHEYMLYQTLIGSWPGEVDSTYVDRIVAYAMKAAREGKQQTSWTNPNEAYEKAFEEFIRAILDPGNKAFLTSFNELASRTSLIGALSSLSQLTLKALQPGVPDFYQGTELWDFSLVDPDNRRPVDYARRHELAAAPPDDWDSLSADWNSGAIKFALLRKLTALRTAMPRLFEDGGYHPIDLPDADNYLAFARRRGSAQCIAIVARRFQAVTMGGREWPQEWPGTVTLPGRAELFDLLGRTHRTGEPITLTELFGPLPVAVLSSRL
jgi:(1->4)-alpha-D-glucan 1-alpha-D-glucosylmutase